MADKKQTQILLINDMAGYGKVALSVMIPVLSHLRFETFNLPTLQEQMENVRAMTTYLDKALSELAAQKVVIKEVRGLGLMKGIELSVPAAYYINALQEAGIIVIPSGSHVIRLLPPLILEKEHIDALLYVLKKIL